jgi:hypothetical protein
MPLSMRQLAVLLRANKLHSAVSAELPLATIDGSRQRKTEVRTTGTQEELGDRSGISSRYVGAIERSKVSPSA